MTTLPEKELLRPDPGVLSTQGESFSGIGLYTGMFKRPFHDPGLHQGEHEDVEAQ